MTNNWKNWRSLRWWWHARVPANAKIMAAVLLAGVVLAGGYFASSHLTGASAANNASDSFVLQTTISKVVTVKEHGRVVVKRVPIVVRRTIVRSRTATAFATSIETRVVTTPGGVRYVTKKVVQYKPVIHKRTVYRDGKTSTVTETRLVPTVKTQTSVVTNQQTVTNQSTVVVNRTNTVTQPVTTVQTHTVTLPPETVTQTQTETQTETVTDTVVTTVQAPPQTVTVTLPEPD
jgi:hypothetical protein